MAKTKRRVLLEVSLVSVEDAQTAEAGGADRIELAAALALGGLTPSLGMLIEVKQAVKVPVMVMIRPRRGGFLYSEQDFKVMQRDIDLALTHGADGIVFGMLDEHGSVDAERCQKLVQQIGKKDAVFHRAIDVTPDPVKALEQLVQVGVTRVLTSGQEDNAYNGAQRIAELIQRAAGRIEVMPAGGVTRFNVTDVVARTGCTQVQASLRRTRVDPSTAAKPHINFGASLARPEDIYDATNPLAVTYLREVLGR